MQDSIEELKKKLATHTEDHIRFTPHCLQQILLRDGKKEEIINNIIYPENLVYSNQEKGKYGDTIHCLHFAISNTRTMRIPVIFKDGNIYIITYIMRYRHWRNMIR